MMGLETRQVAKFYGRQENMIEAVPAKEKTSRTTLYVEDNRERLVCSYIGQSYIIGPSVH